MQIIEKQINDVKPYRNNPRKNDDAVKYLENSIKSFGFKQPIVIDKNNIIICGHTRWKAAKKLKMKIIPCIMADDLTEEQIKAYRLADNKIAEIANWDFELLDKELESIFDFDMSDFDFNFPLDMEAESSKADTNGEGNYSETINGNTEIDASEFSDNSFSCECPRCGFKFER